MGSHIISEGLTDHDTPSTGSFGRKQYSGHPWLNRRPQDGEMPLPRFCGLHHMKFLTHIDVSGPRDFWAVRQKKTLALAQVLQTCTEESGFPTGVLCESVQELQKCMAPLMALSSDEIVKFSLLRPTGEEHGASPTPEEEAARLGEVELPQVPEQLEVHELVHAAKQIATPAASPHPLLPNQVASLPRRQRCPSKGSKWIQPVLVSGPVFN